MSALLKGLRPARSHPTPSPPRFVQVVASATVLLILMVAAAPAASAQLMPPMNVYGTVWVEEVDSRAPYVGVVEAVVQGKVVANTTTNESGWYSINIPTENMGGKSSDVVLRVEGVDLATFPFESGASQEQNLRHQREKPATTNGSTSGEDSSQTGEDSSEVLPAGYEAMEGEGAKATPEPEKVGFWEAIFMFIAGVFLTIFLTILGAAVWRRVRGV